MLGELDALFEAPADSRRTVVLMDDLHAHVAADTDAGPMLQDVVASGALVTATGHVGWLTTDPWVCSPVLAPPERRVLVV